MKAYEIRNGEPDKTRPKIANEKSDNEKTGFLDKIQFWWYHSEFGLFFYGMWYDFKEWWSKKN